MNPNTNAEYDPKPVFEPSDLVSYGDVSVRTEGSGNPGPNQDGAVYNS